MTTTKMLQSTQKVRSEHLYTRTDAEKLKRMTGNAPRADGDIRGLLRRHEWGIGVGVVGACISFSLFWFNKETWVEQTAMLLLLVTFTFLALALVALIGYTGLIGESFAANKLKLMSAFAEVEVESNKSFFAFELFSLLATSVKWGSWEPAEQRRLVCESFELYEGVAMHQSDEEVAQKIHRLRRQLEERSPNNRIPEAVEKKLSVVEQLVLH